MPKTKFCGYAKERLQEMTMANRRAKDFGAWLFVQDYGDGRLTQDMVANWLGITQTAVSKKKRTGSWELEDVIRILMRFSDEKKEEAFKWITR